MYADVVNGGRRAKKPQLLFFNVINITIVILKYKEASRAENTTKASSREQMLRHVTGPRLRLHPIKEHLPALSNLSLRAST